MVKWSLAPFMTHLITETSRERSVSIKEVNNHTKNQLCGTFRDESLYIIVLSDRKGKHIGNA